ncbi:hypothetical protein TNCV_3270971 [Trichonephila clavipes]|nr:hypothetical protein TNCV_3270971 [Trichonephila clavipes]
MHPRGHYTPRSSHLFANSATDVEFRGCKRSAQQRSFPLPSPHANGAGTLLSHDIFTSRRLMHHAVRRLSRVQWFGNRVVSMKQFNVTSQRNAIGMLPMQPFPNIHSLESCVQTMVERFPPPGREQRGRKGFTIRTIYRSAVLLFDMRMIERQLQNCRQQRLESGATPTVIVFRRARVAACTLPQTGYSSRPRNTHP